MVQYLLYCWYRKSGKYWARQSLFKLNFKTNRHIIGNCYGNLFNISVLVGPLTYTRVICRGVQTYWHQSEFVLARRSQIFNTGWSFAIAVYDVLGARFLTVWRHNIVSGKTVYALWRHFEGSVAVVWRQLRSQCDDSLTTPLCQYDGSVTVCDDRTTKSLPVMRGSLRRHEFD